MAPHGNGLSNPYKMLVVTRTGILNPINH